ncbi:hypothetical protein AB6Q56_14800 [Dechloromonas sp. ARDL1]|uniref:hypothetical protein n=1 Tax=Dechloromonas sp. ARDL1 TaxID=3322121 RepID=UPI003DA6DD57
MNDTIKKAPTKPTNTSKAPKKQVPRPATKAAAPAAASAPPPRANAEPAPRPIATQAPRTAAKPAKTPAAPTASKPRVSRKPNVVEETVAKHQKVLADALVKAQAIKYDQPKVMQQAVPKKGKADKVPKAKKIKLVRDSYAMPEAEHARIGELKKRLAALGNEVKKSELLRGGIALLAALNDSELKAVMGRIERIKTGRPKK